MDIVVEWSREWKLNLNADKSEAAFFTTATREIKYQSTIFIAGEIIKVNPNPRLLGVYLDPQLSFNEYSKYSKQLRSQTLR